MFQHKINRHTPTTAIFHWLLLAFVGGDVNAGGLLACGKFVSHVTGFYTLFGQSAANFTWDAAAGLASIPFYFLAGVMTSAFLVERPIHRGEKPHYVLVMGLACACLTLVVVLGHFGFFGAFGNTRLSATYVFIALLCMASGLQNGAVSIASKNTVRITHMTGNTTDVGIGIVRTLAMPKSSVAYADEVRAVILRIGIITTFALGSAVGAIFFLRFGYDGFLLPAAIAFYILIRETVRDRRSSR